MSLTESEKIYRCYKNNYKNLNCSGCEMNWMCEAWRKRDGINPLTKNILDGKFPPFNPRTVA